jgi:hypothetical protein
MAINGGSRSLLRPGSSPLVALPPEPPVADRPAQPLQYTTDSRSYAPPRASSPPPPVNRSLAAEERGSQPAELRPTSGLRAASTPLGSASRLSGEYRGEEVRLVQEEQENDYRPGTSPAVTAGRASSGADALSLDGVAERRARQAEADGDLGCTESMESWGQGGWACDACSEFNRPGHFMCKACGKPRVAASTQLAPPAQQRALASSAAAGRDRAAAAGHQTNASLRPWSAEEEGATADGLSATRSAPTLKPKRGVASGIVPLPHAPGKQAWRQGHHRDQYFAQRVKEHQGARQQVAAAAWGGAAQGKGAAAAPERWLAPDGTVRVRRPASKASAVVTPVGTPTAALLVAARTAPQIDGAPMVAAQLPADEKEKLGGSVAQLVAARLAEHSKTGESPLVVHADGSATLSVSTPQARVCTPPVRVSTPSRAARAVSDTTMARISEAPPHSPSPHEAQMQMAASKRGAGVPAHPDGPAPWDIDGRPPSATTMQAAEAMGRAQTPPYQAQPRALARGSPGSGSKRGGSGKGASRVRTPKGRSKSPSGSESPSGLTEWDWRDGNNHAAGWG